MGGTNEFLSSFEEFRDAPLFEGETFLVIQESALLHENMELISRKVCEKISGSGEENECLNAF